MFATHTSHTACLHAHHPATTQLSSAQLSSPPAPLPQLLEEKEAAKAAMTPERQARLQRQAALQQLARSLDVVRDIYGPRGSCVRPHKEVCEELRSRCTLQGGMSSREAEQQVSPAAHMLACVSTVSRAAQLLASCGPLRMTRCCARGWTVAAGPCADAQWAGWHSMHAVPLYSHTPVPLGAPPQVSQTAPCTASAQH